MEQRRSTQTVSWHRRPFPLDRVDAHATSQLVDPLRSRRPANPRRRFIAIVGMIPPPTISW